MPWIIKINEYTKWIKAGHMWPKRQQDTNGSPLGLLGLQWEQVCASYNLCQGLWRSIREVLLHQQLWKHWRISSNSQIWCWIHLLHHHQRGPKIMLMTFNDWYCLLNFFKIKCNISLIWWVLVLINLETCLRHVRDLLENC